MHNAIHDLLGAGVPAILVGVAALILLVQRELGPFAGLSRGGKWLLTGAFGMGILAFALKVSVAVAVTRMPERLIPQGESAPPSALPGWADAGGAQAKPYVWQALPEAAPQPTGNPASPEKVALGRRLFNETALSGDGKLSCASCHDLHGSAGADGRQTARGIAGQVGSRNTPTVWNAAFQSVLFWDGRAASLEEQAQGPILNPIEMGMASPARAEAALRAIPGYREGFVAAFGDGEITFPRIAAAIAAYERTLITPDTPYDRFVRGDQQALSAQQLRGMARFAELGCVSCHKGPNFSDASLLGGELPRRIFPALPGDLENRFDLTPQGRAAGLERGTWRIPSLRNVALTAPYFHNGAVEKLEDAVRIMASAQLGASVPGAPRPAGNVYWSAQGKVLERVERRQVSEQDVADLVAFLGALSSERLMAAR